MRYNRSFCLDFLCSDRGFLLLLRFFGDLLLGRMRRTFLDRRKPLLVRAAAPEEKSSQKEKDGKAKLLFSQFHLKDSIYTIWNISSQISESIGVLGRDILITAGMPFLWVFYDVFECQFQAVSIIVFSEL